MDGEAENCDKTEQSAAVSSTETSTQSGKSL